jgi:hypothetical protein
LAPPLLFEPPAPPEAMGASGSPDPPLALAPPEPEEPPELAAPPEPDDPPLPALPPLLEPPLPPLPALPPLLEPPLPALPPDPALPPAGAGPAHANENMAMTAGTARRELNPVLLVFIGKVPLASLVTTTESFRLGKSTGWIGQFFIVALSECTLAGAERSSEVARGSVKPNDSV